jgi:hypothetical protein
VLIQRLDHFVRVTSDARFYECVREWPPKADKRTACKILSNFGTAAPRPLVPLKGLELKGERQA